METDTCFIVKIRGRWILLVEDYFENSYGFTVNGINHRVKHAVQALNVFHHLVLNVESIGMNVNTGLSDSLAYQADSYIKDASGTPIRAITKMKALEFRGCWSCRVSKEVVL